jgi:hypothetical protein
MGEYFLAHFYLDRGDTLSPRPKDQFLTVPKDIMIFLALAKKYS